MQSPGSLIPMTCGILRPMILLPAEAEEWAEERRSVVLLHELAHIKRADCLTQAAARLVRAVYWFNPLAWLAGRMLRIERERACDDRVLAAGHKASAYASHLLEIVSTLQSVRCPSLAAVAMARRSQFEGRMLAILDPRRSRRRLTRLGLAAAALLVVGVVLPLSMLRATAANKAEKSEKPAAAVTDSAAAAAVEASGAAAALSPELAKKRDQLLAEADLNLRQGLRDLAKTFPQLALAGNQPLEEALKKSKSEAGRLVFDYGRQMPTTTKYIYVPDTVPPAEKWKLMAVIQPIPPGGWHGQMGMGPFCPHLDLQGQWHADAGEPKLQAALQKLLDDALAPLLALDREAAGEKPPAPNPAVHAAGNKDLRLDLSRQEFPFFGEPWASLQLTAVNTGKETLHVGPRYALASIGPDGKQVTDGSGLRPPQPTPIEPGKSVELSKWAFPPQDAKPGRYQVWVQYFTPDGAEVAAESNKLTIDLATPEAVEQKMAAAGWKKVEDRGGYRIYRQQTTVGKAKEVLGADLFDRLYPDLIEIEGRAAGLHHNLGPKVCCEVSLMVDTTRSAADIALKSADGDWTSIAVVLGPLAEVPWLQKGMSSGLSQKALIEAGARPVSYAIITEVETWMLADGTWLQVRRDKLGDYAVKELRVGAKGKDYSDTYHSAEEEWARDIKPADVVKLADYQAAKTAVPARGKAASLPPELEKKRDALMAQADEKLRQGLRDLAKTFPALATAGYHSLEEALKDQPPQSGRIQIWLAHNARSQLEPVPEAQTWNLLVYIQPIPPGGGGTNTVPFPFCPHLALDGQWHAVAGDPKLKAALQKLLDDVLAPLLALDREAAGEKPAADGAGPPIARAPAAAAKSAVALAPELLKKRDQLLAEADQKLREGLRDLAQTFPQLCTANNKPLEDAMKNYPSGPAGHLSVFFGRGNTMTLTPWQPEAIADAQTWSLLAFIRVGNGTGAGETVAQLGVFEFCPHLNLFGQWHAKAGDAKLQAALQKLLDDALAPLKALDAEAAGEKPATVALKADGIDVDLGGHVNIADLRPDGPLPGSGLTLEEVMKTPNRVIAACEAIDNGGVILIGPNTSVYVIPQKFKVIERFDGAAERGQEVLIRYTFIDSPPTPERLPKKGEQILWIATVEKGDPNVEDRAVAWPQGRGLHARQLEGHRPAGGGDRAPRNSCRSC